MLKSHDVVVAVKLIRSGPSLDGLTYSKLSNSVGLSASETHAAVSRGLAAGLLRKNAQLGGKGIPLANHLALSEFLVHGLKYVWPGERGPITRGVPTASSNPAVATLLNLATPTIPLVWPSAEGTARGEGLEPLHPRAAEICARDSDLHTWLSLIDTIRTRAGREAALAAAEIEHRLL